jgi:hypothetical protein
MILRTLMKRTLEFLVVGFTISALAAAAHARTLPGQGGHPYLAAGITSYNIQDIQNCIQDAGGAALNTCASEVYWIAALPVDSAGVYAPGISVLSPDIDHTVQCVVASGDESGAVVGYSGWWSAPVGGTFRMFPPRPISVPDRGHLFTICKLPQNAKFINVIW